MKTLKLFLIVGLLVVADNIFADELYVENFTIAPGETKTISVELNNPDVAYTLLEFNLSLPEGVSIAKDEDDEWLVEGNATRFTRSHQLEVELQNDGSYKFLIYSSRNIPLNGSSGEIFSMTLTASETIANGTYQGRFHDQLFADSDEQEYDPTDATFNICVGNTLLGDVNGDKQVTIADVTALVNIILGKDNIQPYMYDHDAADVNQDNSITIPDVTALVNVILGKQ